MLGSGPGAGTPWQAPIQDVAGTGSWAAFDFWQDSCQLYARTLHAAVCRCLRALIVHRLWRGLCCRLQLWELL